MKNGSEIPGTSIATALLAVNAAVTRSSTLTSLAVLADSLSSYGMTTDAPMQGL